MDNIVIKIEPPDFFDGDATGEMFASTSSEMFATSSSDMLASSSNGLDSEMSYDNKITHIKQEPSLHIKQEPSEHSNEIDYNSLGEFCFENDHPALKHNSDYKKLIQVSYVLLYWKHVLLSLF